MQWSDSTATVDRNMVKSMLPSLEAGCDVSDLMLPRIQFCNHSGLRVSAR